MTSKSPSLRTRSLGWAAFAAAAWVAIAFGQAGHFYDGFPQPAGAGFTVPAPELAFQALYLAYGVPFVLLVSFGLGATGLGAALVRAWRAFVRHPRAPHLVVLCLGLGAIAVRFFVLERWVVTDDEQVYLFIAKTLLQGGVVNPLPDDAQFLANQFVLVTARGWYGMYPIGHSIVLALGMLTGTLDVIVCLLGCATAALTFDVARRTVGRRRAVGALALLALSPHFVWSHATLLSQVSCGFGLMAGAAAWLRWRRHRTPRWLVLAGLGFAFSVLARPMPGGLFAFAAVLATIAELRAQRATVRELIIFVAAIAPGFALVGLVNFVQSGSPFTSGYNVVHQGTYVLAGERGVTGLSVFGALWRENVWLFGWPLSLLPLLFTRARRHAWLLWAPIGAELVYRLVVPKTVVSTTGPAYLLEMTPMLAVLASDGLSRAAVLARRALGRPLVVPGVVVASTVAAACFFVPVQLTALRSGVEAYTEVWRLLEAEKIDRAVVFSPYLLTPERGKSWAFYAPTASPTLDDALFFVRWPRFAPDPAKAAWEFSQKHFPDRPAYLYVPETPGRLVRLPFESPEPTP